MPPPESLLHPGTLASMRALAETSPSGALVEVGVYRGGSAVVLAEVAAAKGLPLHLFDTFAGIPERQDFDNHQLGDFGDVAVADVMAAVPSAVFHVGVFPKTVPDDLPAVGFAHIDCDNYASVAACIDRLWPLMAPGGVMLFDDYDMTRGATKAVDERFPAGALCRTPQNRAYVIRPHEETV